MRLQRMCVVVVTLGMLACLGSPEPTAGPVPTEPGAAVAEPAAPEAVAPAPTGCPEGDDLVAGTSGACRGSFTGVEEGDFFWLGLTREGGAQTSLPCGPCTGCESLLEGGAAGRPVTLHWTARLDSEHSGSVLPLVDRCVLD